MTTNKEQLEKTHGWHAHYGTRCARCGELLGPFHFADSDKELWGCASCGIGVAFGEKHELGINAAADRYVAMTKTITVDTVAT